MTDVERIGDTVRRATGPWTPAVHALLRHLEQTGFDAAPRVLGFDDRGREVLSYVEGTVGDYPLDQRMCSDEALVGAARLLRRFHDATVGFAHNDDYAWQSVHPDGARHDVICHNDVAPYNVAFVDGRASGLIDFDLAGPGPRVWDVAYAAYRFAPLSGDEQCVTFGWPQPPDRAARLRLFCDAYGLDDRSELLDCSVQHIEEIRNGLLERAREGGVGIERQIREDHIGSYARDLSYIASARRELASAL